MQLAGSNVLLTGASGGIGKATAKALAGRGARVILSGRRTDALEELRSELGGDAAVVGADLADRGALPELLERSGAVDVLVANAALPASGAVASFSAEEIDRALDVNLRAPILLAHALAPAMADHGRGHLVFVSSLSGKISSGGSAIYSATKFGLRAFATGLREDLLGSGVGVTTVYPGFISDAGMFAEADVKLPPGVGTRPPEAVAAAVVRGIEENKSELDVAPLGMRVGARIWGLSPTGVGALQRRLGSLKVADELAAGQRDKR
jgi:short-subunit dehydrogenase